jgi:hypothetical protein
MNRVYYVVSLVPLILVLIFFYVARSGPGGQTGFGQTIAAAQAIVICCPIITLLGLILICVQAVNHKDVVGPIIATIVAVLPGIIFWMIENRQI